MSFYTALTGLNGAQADLSATSNNIANVGTTGFKRSRAEFGDIFATSPLQSSASAIGSGAILKGIRQQFTQGNIASSLNVLDLAISGQGFFALKPSLGSSQTVFTRNGSFSVDNNRYVVDSTGQHLLVYPVNQDGSVTARDLISAVPLQLPVSSGDPKATSRIELGVNLPAGSTALGAQDAVPPTRAFDPADPRTFTNSTSITIFDDLGNPTIATVYFIKTQLASAQDPTSKFDTKLVINGTVVEPNLVKAVDQRGRQIFIDRFGNQTSQVPDDNYYLDGRASPLYKLDDLRSKVPSQPARMTGATSFFDFGPEGDRLVEIVTDPLMFHATRDSGNAESNVYWGRDFLMVNVDDGDQPVSVNIRPGKYTAAQLAAEVERAINEAYGDDRKIRVVKNVDDRMTIDLFRLNSDGTTIGLQPKLTLDLLRPSFVSEQLGINLDVPGPNFRRDEFLAHMQATIVNGLNDYIFDSSGAISAPLAEGLGVGQRLFTRAAGERMGQVYRSTEVISFDYAQQRDGVWASQPKHLVYSTFANRPTLSVYDNRTALSAAGAGNAVTYDPGQNTLTINVPADFDMGSSPTIRLAGTFASDLAATHLNGRELRVFEVVDLVDADGAPYKRLRVDTTQLGMPDTPFSLAANGAISILSGASEEVEAFFEGAGADGGLGILGSERIVLREKGAAATRSVGYFDGAPPVFTVTGALLGGDVALQALGLQSAGGAAALSSKVMWVDERNPPIRANYDHVNQRFQFSVERGSLGEGSPSNFHSFSVFGYPEALSVNNLGIPGGNDRQQVQIRGEEVLSTRPFVAQGGDIQPNDRRYGIRVTYNSDTRNFSIASGTTGESIAANGAVGVRAAQSASNIQVGRRTILADGSVDPNESFDRSARTLGFGDNHLMGFGLSKSSVGFEAGRGLAAQPATVRGGTALVPLNQVFRLSELGGENRFSISVNGISGVIELPPGSYVGSSLAAALEERINQIEDPLTGRTVGGVKVRYLPDSNSFEFTTGTTGDNSIIRVRGAARFGLDDVALGVGSVPQIFNLVQATSPEGLPLYVDASGKVVTTPPDNLVSGYFPLYIDEGELTFDRAGRLLSPSTSVRYDQFGSGVSLSLDIDFSGSTQFAQPFSVLTLQQDGFASGRLDGIEIDASGVIRASYTNGQNKPLGKVVLATFNNQNGLKQIGNATYVATASSGAPQVGEAGGEGLGNILSGSLERSNVDITEELVNLITAQRNFQASAKAIETTTTLTQTIINIRG
ncbi:flagellar hook-basal body complex protein [Plastorhodobacter daqingensis]|uniref:Flagellar hook protein FlgE n=1 Tax=Plastorhodobacter daqingensis TaxID=1387281 RepID=A0ABW2UG55_9RHOB